MNQYPKEEPEDGLISLAETEHRIRESLSKIAERFQLAGAPKRNKFIVLMTPTGIPPQQDWVAQHSKENWPNVWRGEIGESQNLEKPTYSNRRWLPFDLDFSKIENYIATNYAHLLPSFHPNLVEVARIREESIIREQKKLEELSALYGRDMTEKVKEAAEKLNRSIEECIDLFKQFKLVSIAAEKLHHYENVRKLISEIKFQVGESNKKETHATRDKIPVPKSYKRNRWSK